MKNIHVLPTIPNDETAKGIWIKETRDWCNIYITNDGEIKDGEYGICLNLVREGFKSRQAVFKMDAEQRQAMNELGGQKKAEALKVILTTDQDLIKDGVQAIDDEFLEWFVKNPSCERVEIDHERVLWEDGRITHYTYRVIIPKQEMLEEACEKYFNKVSPNICFYDSAKFGYQLAQQQNKNLYSEEDLKQAFFSGCYSERKIKPREKCWEEFIEQFKKK